jgi:hypothetical protein
MIRISFYTGTWSGIPSTGDCYTIPRNPIEAEVQDSSGNSYLYGGEYAMASSLFYDNRPRQLIWENIPATSEYKTMLKNFLSYIAYDSIYVNFGNSLVLGYYATGDDWRKISVNNVEVEDASADDVYMSGGVMYNKYSKITLEYELLGDAS